MFNIVRQGASSVLHVDHELDFQSSGSFASAIDLVARDLDGELVISLAGCSFCDASALTVLIHAKRSLGARLTIVVPSTSRIRRLFQICGLDDWLDLRNEVRDSAALTS